ncbi:MAG: 4Fe-4S binding protein [Lentisphaerae bacterium]|nr:4Fe-4S binding protein [Lentisphaerota bacterium]
MLQFKVDDGRCVRCGACVRDCPAGIIEQAGRALPRILPENEEHCLQCQHCLAVCPKGAVSILGRDPDRSAGLGPESFPGLDAMSLLVRGRRSARQYRAEAVDPALVASLLDTLAHAPTGVNHRGLTFHVIDDVATMQRLRERLQAGLLEAAVAGRLAERFAYLARVVEFGQKSGRDVVLRGAPHALIVSASPEAPCGYEDVILSLATFDLLAQTAGLGTVWCGLLAASLAALPEVAASLGLPPGHRFYGMLFGWPAVRYARTVQRSDAAAVRRPRL